MRLTRQISPLRSLTSDFRQDGLVDAIETCRIFEDSYDFWDESGDGWIVLVQSIATVDACNDKIWPEFFSWFLQSSRQDIKAYYSKFWIQIMIIYASPERVDSIGLLLELGFPGIIDDKREHSDTTPLAHCILKREPNRVRTLLALGADPHQSVFWRVTDRVESPLSLAMYLSWDFCSFRDALMEMNLHVEDIVRRELEQGGPLVDDGWQVETLNALLKLNFELELEPPGDTEKECSNCRCFLFDSFNYVVQPYWYDILERIKNGTYVQNARSDTQDVQSSSSRSRPSISINDVLANNSNGNILSHDPALLDDQSKQSDEEPIITENAISGLAPGKEDMWCIDCWLHFKRTGQRYSLSVPKTSVHGDDSSEADFSPFLFNT